MWTLTEALALIKETQITARKFGYHICLGGGVLNKGESKKDLDLYFIPLIGEEEDFFGMIQSLNIGWGIGEPFGYDENSKLNPYRGQLKFKMNDKVIEVNIV